LKGSALVSLQHRLYGSAKLSHTIVSATLTNRTSLRRARYPVRTIHWSSNGPRRRSWSAGSEFDRCQSMIEFPNHSRSYDQTRRAVRFWGHDSALETSFFIDEDALKRIQPDASPDESGFLNVFDRNRDAICAAAAKIYVRGSRGSYNLVAANF